ncbi:MAG: hypothetical protein Q4D58_07235 [Synergistaceae bacterium]|nr:hypothetical protein [Synergistaceae bacterium]
MSADNGNNYRFTAGGSVFQLNLTAGHNIIKKCKERKMTMSAITTINVSMLGPSRCGKTSMLASMLNRAQDVFHGITGMGDVSLGISDGDVFTRTNIDRAYQSLVGYYNRKDTKEPFLNDSEGIGVLGTGVSNTYKFTMKARGSDMVDFNFYDFPGGYFMENACKNYGDADIDNAHKKLAKSDIIYITIDTPYLMTGDKDINERRNISESICKYACKVLKEENTNMTVKKTVIFVPMKSEKWIINYDNNNNNHMSISDSGCKKVLEKVKETYATLIEFVKESEGLLLWGYMPLATLGGVRFKEFSEKKDNDDNKLELFEYVPGNFTSPAMINSKYLLTYAIWIGILDICFKVQLAVDKIGFFERMFTDNYERGMLLLNYFGGLRKALNADASFGKMFRRDSLHDGCGIF